jgi:hypothetical protein
MDNPYFDDLSVKEKELLDAARHAISVANILMNAMNLAFEHDVAPGPVWGEAFKRLNAAIDSYSAVQ